KYAEVGPAAALASTPPEQMEPAITARPTEAPAEIPLVLPGESLAKYRGGPPAREEHGVEHVRPASVPPPLPVEEDLDVQTEQRVYEEPIHYPPENALPDAPSHSAP